MQSQAGFLFCSTEEIESELLKNGFFRTGSMDFFCPAKEISNYCICLFTILNSFITR
jgi:hypothetical protein